MDGSFIEAQLENALRSVFGNKSKRIVRYISRMAARQGGGSTLENYQLLGQRVFIVAGVAVVTVQVVSSVVGFVISRRNEEKRMERVARRVIEEERRKEELAA